MRRTTRAFTLIELITVMAISAILLTLILYPLVQALGLVKQAQAFAGAQERARLLGERIATEISASAGVRDNSGYRGAIAVDPMFDPSAGVALLASGETSTATFLPYAKVDLLEPASGSPVRGPSGGLIDPRTGKEDPTLQAPSGQVNLPVAVGGTLVRYWIGLKDPTRIYNNPYSTLSNNAANGILAASRGGRDNLYVLRRAVVQPMVYSAIQHKFVVNKALFYDLGRIKITAAGAATAPSHQLPSLYQYPAGLTGPAYDYPAFFDPNDVTYAWNPATPDPDGTPDPTPAQMVQSWVNHSTIVTQLDHSDMIQPVFDRRTLLVDKDLQAPRIIPLIQFKPSRISNQPAEGQVAVRPGEETDNALTLAPDVYRTQYGEWSNQVIRTYPDTWDQTKPAPADLYLVGRHRLDVAGDVLGTSVFGYDPSTDGPENTGGKELFDISTYVNVSDAGGSYPFTQAVAAANGRSAWLSSPVLLANFIPYFSDSTKGQILASFGINEVGGAPIAPPPAPPTGALPDPNNLPQSFETSTQTPATDSAVAVAWSPQDPAGTYDINRSFNRAWNDPILGTLRPDLQRFVDLRVMTQGDGTPSPLDPTNGFPRASVVPGSEQIFGPDQKPGPNYGRPVQYVRTTQNPGPNQYRINYVDQTEPNYSLLGLGPAVDPGFNPAVYSPTDITSAVIQPRYKAGYVQFESDPNIPLPTGSYTDPVLGPIVVPYQIYYRFQFTHPQDVFAVDYDSRQVMSVLLTVKHFPQQGLSSYQNVTIPVTAKVRNFLR